MRRFTQLTLCLLSFTACADSDGVAPTSPVASLTPAASDGPIWDGKPLYVSPANVIYEGDPHELPTYIIHSPTAGGAGVKDVGDGRCYVDEDGNSLCLWSVTGNAGADRPGWIVAIAAGIIGTWISDQLDDDSWTDSAGTIVSGCAARGQETIFRISNGGLTHHECRDP